MTGRETCPRTTRHCRPARPTTRHARIMAPFVSRGRGLNEKCLRALRFTGVSAHQHRIETISGTSKYFVYVYLKQLQKSVWKAPFALATATR